MLLKPVTLPRALCQVKEGPLVLEIYKKPADPKRKRIRYGRHLVVALCMPLPDAVRVHACVPHGSLLCLCVVTALQCPQQPELRTIITHGLKPSRSHTRAHAFRLLTNFAHQFASTSSNSLSQKK